MPVALKVSHDEFCRRVQSAERIGKKHTDPVVLLRQLSRSSSLLHSIGRRPPLRLTVTSIKSGLRTNAFVSSNIAIFLGRRQCSTITPHPFSLR